MKCKKCGKNLQKDWKYCPYCGTQIKKLQIPRLFGKRNNIEEQMEEMFEMFGFPNVKVKFQTNVIPPQDIPTPKQQVAVKHRPINIHRVVKKIIEPEAKIKRIGNETHITIILPDVKSIKDISLRRLEESLEIRAYANKTMYFKVIPINKNVNNISETFSKNVLRIILNE